MKNKTTPTMHDIVLDKYDERMRNIYDALDELKGIMARDEFKELHQMLSDGSLSGDPLEERVEMTFGDFEVLLDSLKDAYIV
jgi:hypothetical protein